MGKESDIDNSDGVDSTRLEEPEPNGNSTEAPDEKDIIEPVKEIRDDPTDEISDEKVRSGGKGPSDVEVDNETVSDEETEEDETASDGATSEIENKPESELQTAAVDGNEANDFMGLDDDETDDLTPKDKKPELEEVNNKRLDNDKSENNAGENSQTRDDKDSSKKKKTSRRAKSHKAKMAATGPPSSRKMISLALFVLIIAGFIVYTKPSLVGFKKELKPVPRKTSEAGEPVQILQKHVRAPKPPSKHDNYMAKLEDADELRKELLEKKEEIYQLKRYLHSRITELQDQIALEMQNGGITSFAQASKNKFIELNLRTIQRRRAYIRELEKPVRWIQRGSEELLYLKRKAELDLQLIDIAGGIDLDRHMRHIGAAIQKYRPSAKKLAVDPPEPDLKSLEMIWSQIRNQQEKIRQMQPELMDKEIIEEICSGNFERIAELSSISAMAAKCLSKMNRSDLFLNGLTKLSSAEAKYLFQWHGNWICLNGVKELSPAVAQYLFEWEGNWISLNGLTEFSAELAMHLMKWKGKQLELMGLNYTKKADQRTLKYLAQWETTGGKLFISDTIRKEMERVMM